MKRISLDLSRIGITATQSAYERNEDLIRGTLMHTISGFVACEKQKPFEVSYPKTWWQHFKQRWFPQWILKKYPVVQTTITASVKTLYPHLRSKLPLDLMGPSVMLMVNDGPVGAFMPDCNGMTKIEWREEVDAILIKEIFASADKCPCCHRAWFERFK